MFAVFIPKLKCIKFIKFARVFSIINIYSKKLILGSCKVLRGTLVKYFVLFTSRDLCSKFKKISVLKALVLINSYRNSRKGVFYIFDQLFVRTSNKC